jgi:hypothetical protein
MPVSPSSRHPLQRARLTRTAHPPQRCDRPLPPHQPPLIPQQATPPRGRQRAPSSSKNTVHLVNDQTLGVERSVYHTAKAEKDARAEEYSAVKRLLSRDDIVIADGLNYIKGFRYQLYCEAKAVQTPSCVVSLSSLIR